MRCGFARVIASGRPFVNSFVKNLDERVLTLFPALKEPIRPFVVGCCQGGTCSCHHPVSGLVFPPFAAPFCVHFDLNLPDFCALITISWRGRARRAQLRFSLCLHTAATTTSTDQLLSVVAKVAPWLIVQRLSSWLLAPLATLACLCRSQS